MTGGRRCSVIFWFTNTEEACRAKSRPWYKAAAAAGDADAQYNLGKDIAYDQPREGLELLRSASEQGHFVAQNDLGVMLMRGQGCPGAEPDLVAAEYWFNAAAEQGFHRAMLSMGFLCAERGQPAEALEWLQRAAEQRADPEVMFSLGMCYRDGRLTAEKDLVKAREYLEGAATMGHPRAQLAMGQLVEAEAEREMWLMRSAEQGNSQAMLSLARHYVREWRLLELGQFVGQSCRRAAHMSSKWSWSIF